MKSSNLLLQVLIKFIAAVIVLGVVLFIPAGTIKYFNGLLFATILFVPMILVGIFLYIKDPDLLRKRLNNREVEKEQQKVIFFSAIQFIAVFIIAGLDFRFGWSKVNIVVVTIATIIFIISYIIYVEVMRENAYLSRTVEIQKNQKVIASGLYGIVRHPMYFGVTLLFLSMPLVLGSWFSLIVMLPFPMILAKRIKNEEEVLKKGLEGYEDYMKKVKYHMIPFIW